MDKVCLNCGKTITGRNKYYCCQSCRAEHLKNKRTCAVCGKVFWAAPSSAVVTCGLECEKKNRSRRSQEDEAIIHGLKKAHEVAKIHPNTAPCQTNINAKSWVLQSPDGKIYEIDNLANWARYHEDILPSPYLTFYRGIICVKRTMQGKRERGSYHYKGWIILNFYVENKSREDMPPRKGHKERTKMTDVERLERKRTQAREYYKRKNSI